MRNTITGIGYVVDTPVLRETNSGKKVCTFRMCLSPPDSIDMAYVDLQVWERQAEVANEYLVKGREIYIEGELKFRTWEDKEGKKGSKHYIACRNFTFVSSNKKKEDGDGEGVPAEPAATPKSTSKGKRQPVPDDEDDIPF